MKLRTRFPLNFSHINALPVSFFFIWSLAKYLVRSTSHEEPQKFQSWRTSKVPVMKNLRSASHEEPQKFQSWRTSEVPVVKNLTSVSQEEPQKYQSWRTSQVSVMKNLTSSSHEEPQKFQSWRTSEVPVLKNLRTASHEEPQKYQPWRTSEVPVVKNLRSASHEEPQKYQSWRNSEVLVMKNLRSTSEKEPQKCQSWRASEVPAMKSLRSSSHEEPQKCQSWRISLRNLQFSSCPALPRPNNLPQSHSQTQIMIRLQLTLFFPAKTHILFPYCSIYAPSSHVGLLLSTNILRLKQMSRSVSAPSVANSPPSFKPIDCSCNISFLTAKEIRKLPINKDNFYSAAWTNYKYINSSGQREDETR